LMIIQLILLMLPQKQRPPNSFHTPSASSGHLQSESRHQFWLTKKGSNSL
jgi:hypothetical protein